VGILARLCTNRPPDRNLDTTDPIDYYQDPPISPAHLTKGLPVLLLTRRRFGLSAGAAAASLSVIGTVEGAAGSELAVDAPPLDPEARLNLQFRELYGINRQELWEATPLAALTLIGTGELWRVEFGRVVKSYPPPAWIAKVKGLMHSVIGTQATWARLLRARPLNTGRESASVLATGLSQLVKIVPTDLPPEVAPQALIVLEALHELADGWAGGKPATPDDLPATMKRVRPDIERVVNVAGEAIYESLVNNLQALIRESKPNDWEQCLVGVCGVGFARRDSLEIAAAMSVMGRDAVGTKLLYLENAFTIPAGMSQLAAALTDRELGQAVFGDPYRMWRDLMSDVAIRHAGGSFFPEMGRPG
jgi:hypothetical protein